MARHCSDTKILPQQAAEHAEECKETKLDPNPVCIFSAFSALSAASALSFVFSHLAGMDLNAQAAPEVQRACAASGRPGKR